MNIQKFEKIQIVLGIHLILLSLRGIMGPLKIFYGLKTTPFHNVDEKGDARDYMYNFY